MCGTRRDARLMESPDEPAAAQEKRAMHPAIAPAIAPYVDADRRRAARDAHRALMPHVESPLVRPTGPIHRAAGKLTAVVRRTAPAPAARIGVADPC
jgi:hypothetical protein